MKSRTLKAICAAVSAVAVLATAMTGFAATTTYDATNNKVIVTETVTAEANSEVTYLVKSNNQIVYIDQTTALPSGTATFNYKIDADKIVNLETTATFGTDGATAVAGGSAALALQGLTNVNGDTFTITYSKSIVGNNDTVTAAIAAKDGYVIADVVVDNVSQGAVASVEVGYGAVIEVATEKAVQAPVITDSVTADVEDEIDGVTYKAKVTVISATGDFKSVGVACKGIYYPALKVENGKAAVKLILPDGSETVNVEAVVETLD